MTKTIKTEMTINETARIAIGYHRAPVILPLSFTLFSTPKQDGTSVVYWMTNWTDKPSQQANTTIFWVNNQIIEADVRVNAQNFQYSTDLSGGTVDVQSLLTHEFGHVLGLKHEDSQPSVMATYLPNAFDRRDLKATDAASLKCEY
jgi:hypothetical protein